MVLDSVRVNDGQWHHVQVKWMADEVWINLGESSDRQTALVASDFMPLYRAVVAWLQMWPLVAGRQVLS